MSMGLFRILDEVLTQATTSICRAFGINEDEAIHRTREYLGKNSAAYYADNSQLEYQDPLCRIAYLYSYVCAHANLVDNACCYLSNLQAFLRDKLDREATLNVCSLGGGPGSELLGLVKFIDRGQEPGKQVYVDFALVDSVREWDETWQALLRGIEATFSANYGQSPRNWPAIIQRSFLPLDLTRLEDFKHLPTRFQDIELFIFNHTLSELLSHRTTFEQVVCHLASLATHGTYFLIIDRHQQEVCELAHTVIYNAGLRPLEFRVEQTNMDFDEQVTDLGIWFDHMGRSPKLKWNAFFFLAQKPIDNNF